MTFLATAHPTRSRVQHDDRRTPDDLFGPLHAKYGFTVDAAASDANAKLPHYWCARTDGLSQSWKEERVWCNPPYSDVAAWVAKATQESRGGCALIVMLLPANRCEQPWWQQYIEPVRDSRRTDGVSVRVEFIAGRTRFGRPDGSVGSAPPFGCCLVVWERAT